MFGPWTALGELLAWLEKRPDEWQVISYQTLRMQQPD